MFFRSHSANWLTDLANTVWLIGRYDFTNNYTSSPVARLSPADARHVSDYGYTTDIGPPDGGFF